MVGSTRIEEEIFGRAFDGNILRRIWSFVRPHRGKMLVALAAVLAFTATGLLVPLIIIRHAIDRGMAPEADPSVLTWSFLAFLAVILVNYAASRVQETVVGKVAENVLFDMRRAMFGKSPSRALERGDCDRRPGGVSRGMVSPNGLASVGENDPGAGHGSVGMFERDGRPAAVEVRRRRDLIGACASSRRCNSPGSRGPPRYRRRRRGR